MSPRFSSGTLAHFSKERNWWNSDKNADLRGHPINPSLAVEYGYFQGTPLEGMGSSSTSTMTPTETPSIYTRDMNYFQNSHIPYQYDPETAILDELCFDADFNQKDDSTRGFVSAEGGQYFPADEFPLKQCDSFGGNTSYKTRDGFFSNGQHFVTAKNPTISEEDFLKVATNPEGATNKDKINLFIQKKFEAGLLKPFMYYQSYLRMQAYTEMHLTPTGYSRVLSLLESVKAVIRNIVERMSEMDMLVEEEAFQRLTMDYDRYLSAVSVPCALWRRTGEIVRVNESFLQLIGSSSQSFWKRPDLPALYEYLSEDSLINYWERYDGVCVDDSQKAVLTRAFLKKYPCGGHHQQSDMMDPQLIVPILHVPCLFSFTIRRDPYKLARLIIGQFMPVPSSSL